LLAIITDIINIATIEAGQEKVNLQLVNLNSKIDLIYEQFSAKAGKSQSELIFNKGLPDLDAFILSDQTKLVQIISNLLNNALKFAPGGKIELNYQISGSMIEFHVKDNGPGIPPCCMKKYLKGSGNSIRF
jgi:signal transduction histidine kinase